MVKREKGFSLIELLIVVAIILIIAAIAIPNLLRAKIAANQSSAAASLRTLASSAAMYQSTYGNGYPASLTIMGPNATPSCAQAGLIDSNLSGGEKSGYDFTWTKGQTAVSPTPTACTGTLGYSDGFGAQADPVSSNTGTVHYCVDASNVIMSNSTQISTSPTGGGSPACQSGTPIGN